jgi:hypothetical protein
MTSLEEYGQLVEEIDDSLAQFSNLPDALVRCAPGCSQCCNALAVLPIEARSLLAFAHGWSPPVSSDSGRCPLLTKDRRCALYDARPVICRVRGLPVYYLDSDGTPSREVCVKNRFPSDPAMEQPGGVHLELWNARLYRINLRFCAETGIPQRRISMKDLVESAGSRVAPANAELAWVYAFSATL